MELTLSTMATSGIEESGCCKEVAVMGRQGDNVTPFFQQGKGVTFVFKKRFIF